MRNSTGRKQRYCWGPRVTYFLILSLAFTVFKARELVISMEQVEVGSLTFPNNNLNMYDLHLNLSLNVAVSIYNPNHASFRYSEDASYKFYRQLAVGETSVAHYYITRQSQVAPHFEKAG
ncbi:hypothetical protein GOP47_0024567 [Adiantum capillus-veneris]|uniref:Late embryogenesis abundant protein LEA-2 subgroup domain-containing protein n=1 Tax=Adiantum capillus-veneris TaxID=13818 RepID=A0A9D4U2W7_ADICA|nr:hypothetical protein GOP47_0024567 [Adiantum capillus-veneris]